MVEVEPHEKSKKKNKKAWKLLGVSLKMFVVWMSCTDLRELPPIQIVAGIILEDENVIDFGLVPHSTDQTK